MSPEPETVQAALGSVNLNGDGAPESLTPTALADTEHQGYVRALLDEMQAAANPYDYIHALDDDQFDFEFRHQFYRPFIAMVSEKPPHEQDSLVETGRRVLNMRAATLRKDIEALRRASAPGAADATPPPTKEELDALKFPCAEILKAADPLDNIREEIARLGYGGNPDPAIIAYLSATSRLLRMRPGAMPCHLLILGAPSTGKSWTLTIVLSLMPADSYVKIDAGSPRALIYLNQSLRHRLLVFSEADSLPQDEENPASSAVRSLLQDHRLAYDVAVRDKDSGAYATHRIEKDGPTAFISTSIKRLPPQLDTRVFNLEAPEDVARTRAALKKQADLELHPPTAPDSGLIAYQKYLQALAPWDVVTPFADRLAEQIGKTMTEPRIVRDFGKLLALVKAVTVLRHAYRKWDAEGRLISTLADFVTARSLVNSIFEASATRASVRLRETVEAVRILAQQQGPVTLSAVAKKLEIARSSAHERVKRALEEGFVKNIGSWRQGTGFDLRLGEPLPPSTCLPTTEDMMKGHIPPEIDRTPEHPSENPSDSGSRTVGRIPARTVEPSETVDESANRSGVRPVQGGKTGTPMPDRSGSKKTVPERRPRQPISPLEESPPWPTEPCATCGNSRWWISKFSGAAPKCRTCIPPLTDDVIGASWPRREPVP